MYPQDFKRLFENIESSEDTVFKWVYDDSLEDIQVQNSLQAANWSCLSIYLEIMRQMKTEFQEVHALSTEEKLSSSGTNGAGNFI